MAAGRTSGRIASLSRTAVVFTSILVAAALVATAIASGLGDAWWPLELFAHFRLAYLLAAAVFALLALLASWRWSVLVIAAALPHAYVVAQPALVTGSGAAHAYGLPRATGAPPAPVRTPARAVRLLVYNVNLDNRRVEEFVALVERERPDVIVLQEIMQHWPNALKRLPDDYRYRVLGPDPIPDNAIVSRLPILRSRVIRVGSVWLNPVEAEIDAGGTTLRVVSVHLPLPLSREGRDFQTAYLSMLARVARDKPGPLVVAGDFNLTPWTGRFRRFLADGGLSHAAPSSLVARTRYQPGLGIATPVFGLPIDHVLVRGLRPVRDRVGRDIGSDHRPLIVDLGLPVATPGD